MRAGDEWRIGATGDHRDCADEGSASADDPNQPVYVFGTKIGTPDGARNLTRAGSPSPSGRGSAEFLCTGSDTRVCPSCLPKESTRAP